MRPLSWQWEDCGIEHAQYFRGRSTIDFYPPALVVYIGVGDDAREAANDALEQSCMMDTWDGPALERADLELRMFERGDGAHDACDGGDEHDWCELNYYVALAILQAEDE